MHQHLSVDGMANLG